MDNRRSLNLNTWDRMKTDFIEPVQDQFGFRTWIPGNHDLYFKNNLSVNIQSLLGLNRNCDDLINKPKKYDDEIYLPWICKENEEEVFTFIKEYPNKKFVFGHLELAGFLNGTHISDGYAPSLLDGHGEVFTGHFHTRSKISNINYIGAAIHDNWASYDQWRGFSVLDKETGKIKYIKNPFSPYSIINYNEDHIPEEIGKYKDTYCRIFVMNKTSETKFNDFVKRLKGQGIINLDIIETEIKVEEEGTEIRFIDDQEEIFINHIKNLDYSDVKGVELIFRNVYERAKNGDQFQKARI